MHLICTQLAASKACPCSVEHVQFCQFIILVFLDTSQWIFYYLNLLLNHFVGFMQEEYTRNPVGLANSCILSHISTEMDGKDVADLVQGSCHEAIPNRSSLEFF